MESFAHVMKRDALVLSVVAGATIGNIQNTLGEDSRVIRSMPNTPAMIGEGMTVWSQSQEVTEEQHELVRTAADADSCSRVEI
jgi:pyrroline-5-carboxylate reductase